MVVTIVTGSDYNCGVETVRVRVPAHLSHTGKVRWAEKEIDACVADIVRALVEAGVYTDACCCAHGVGSGSILLSDGRVLKVVFPDDWKAHAT